jgi:DNA polymerase elongation subunit (family B)
LTLGGGGAVAYNAQGMARLVFDIETSAVGLEHFDEAQQEYLFREAERQPTEEDKARKRAEISQQFSLWPFTAQVVCIAMINADSGKGQVLYQSDDFDEESLESADPDDPSSPSSSATVEFAPQVDEVELLTAFWDVAKRYDGIVTFNGRGFDVPFLYLRSALLNVPITRKDWLGYRYQTEPHCDLAEQFTFYSVSGREGAARRFNLDFYCKAFGIPSPKAMGVTGMDVASLLAEGRHREIAEYCLRDVVATVELHKLWEERLKGIK